MGDNGVVPFFVRNSLDSWSRSPPTTREEIATRAAMLQHVKLTLAGTFTRHGNPLGGFVVYVDGRLLGPGVVCCFDNLVDALGADVPEGKLGIALPYGSASRPFDETQRAVLRKTHFLELSETLRRRRRGGAAATEST
jgi:hypothetical protein